MNGDAEGIPIQGRLPLELQQIKEEQDAAKAETIKNTYQGEELGQMKHIVKATGVKCKEDQLKETELCNLEVTVPNDERPGNLSIKAQEKNNNGVPRIRRSSRKRKLRWFDDGEKWQGSWKRKRTKRPKSSLSTSEPSKTILCHDPHLWSGYNYLKGRKEENITGKINAAVPWKASDDLALIRGVQQTQDLAAVHLGVKFSRFYSIKEVEERWHTIMYNPAGSRLARAAIRNLPQEVVYRVLQAAPFSREEELAVGACGVSSSQSFLEPDVNQELLAGQAKVFHSSRIAQGLATHWQYMKLYNLLPDQAGIPETHQHTNFHDMEKKLVEEPMELGQSDNLPASDRDRVSGKKMRSLEAEVTGLQAVVEEVTGQQEVQLGDGQTLRWCVP